MDSIRAPESSASISRLPPEFRVPYYWDHHFESVGVKPAPFIHRVMTDYANEEYVAQWIVNMSPLYKTYNKCIDYGKKNGSKERSIEARAYGGVWLICGNDC